MYGALHLSLLQIKTGTESVITAAKQADNHKNIENTDFSIFNIYVVLFTLFITSRAPDSTVSK